MRIRLPVYLLAGVFFSVVTFSRATAPADQTHSEEREFHHPKAEVEKVIQDLHATFNGRLPILDGFASEVDESWDRFTRGYFECAVQVLTSGQQETRVRVTAKITAWHTDPNPAQSGYRVLISNGRVEADLLDRIEEALAPKGSAADSKSSSSVGWAQATPSNPSVKLPSVRIRPDASSTPTVDSSAFVRGERSAASPNPAGSPAAGVIASPATIEDIESLTHRREAAEKKLNDMAAVVHNLDEILHNQTHPTDIAVVRKSGTHVMAKPGANGPVLFSADSEDEFQVLDSGPDWVHVQISGASRGWIRRSHLNLPDALNGSSDKGGATSSASESPFRVVREETNLFKGNWEPLNGKKVKIIWTGPSSALATPASASAKQKFAKSLLASAYNDISSHDREVSGVVIVFDSADGGQIASTLENLTQWQAGLLAEASFWKLCSVDPPELLSP